MRTVIGIVFVLAAVLVVALGLSGGQTELDERTFDFTYTTEIGPLPEHARSVAVWLPFPQEDPNQDILRQEISSPYPTTFATDPEYGNRILHLALDDPGPRRFSVTMTFRVRRREWIRNDFGSIGTNGHEVPPADPRWLEPDRLVPLDERIRGLAAEVTRGQTTDLNKVRAIYDYVVSTMRYDKSGTGWGQGDIYWACDFKRGNCTDFHALFIGLSRAAGVPAKFVIGFPLPPDRGRGRIEGYHCWSEFYLAGYGWVPVDTSEASKRPELRDYFFGAHDPHRVQFSVGRDVVLAPAQQTDPLNYFIYPYVEVDGEPFADVTREFRFEDVNARS